jgi:MFS superfamily sulfate permease-like transporter
MTFTFAAIFFCLLLISPTAGIVFALVLLVFAILVTIAERRVRHRFLEDPDPVATLLAELEAPSADLPAFTITGPDHPLAAIGRVPRGEDR